MQRTVWLDEKAEYLKVVCTYKCYAPDTAESVQREATEPLRKARRVRYTAAVCALIGPVYLKFTTGTEGIDRGYKVCTPVFHLGLTMTKPS